jgi:colanic acid/amylovoran biosynthesis glycosyltransferase
MPVVSTRHCDIPTVLEHGRTGFLAEEKDVDGLAESLRWLIKHPDQWELITDAARKHVELKFNAAIQCLELTEFYNEVMSDRNRLADGKPTLHRTESR